MKRLDMIREKNLCGEQVSIMDVHWVLARVEELSAALRWCGEHAYAAGKSFSDRPEVKEPLAKLDEEEK